jgi:hypothetical protein
MLKVISPDPSAATGVGPSKIAGTPEGGVASKGEGGSPKRGGSAGVDTSPADWNVSPIEGSADEPDISVNPIED